jgi:hypothetical protein
MNTSELMWCSQNDVAIIRLSENFVYDVLAHFSVHDVVALNNYQLLFITLVGME